LGLTQDRLNLTAQPEERDGQVPDVNDFNRAIIEEFRANDGRVGGPFEGSPVLLLTTTGAKTGQRRTTPVVYLPDGERMVIFASKAGAPTNPAWYHNLLANPTVTVEVGTDTIDANAVVTTGEERDRLFRRQAELHPQFAEYQQKTTRQIPVVALERKG
jgi:deazaflavin-dependent oxidoreductase (nitroreductase family)